MNNKNDFALIKYIDVISAVILGLVTLLVFISAVLRYLFSYPIPDGFDLSRLFLGTSIMWGLCTVSYHREHISVDILWHYLPNKYKKIIDIISQTITSSFLLMMSVMLVSKITSVYKSNEQTFDLRLEIWPFYTSACIGLIAATLLTIISIKNILKDDHYKENKTEISYE